MKYPACRHKSFFTRLATRSFEHGKISPVKSPGRPQTYDEDYDHIIKQVVDAKRALQQCASAKQIQDAMKAARLKPLPCEVTIRKRKFELGIIKVDVKFKPQLTAKLMAERPRPKAIPYFGQGPWSCGQEVASRTRRVVGQGQLDVPSWEDAGRK